MAWYNGEWIDSTYADQTIEIKDWCPQCDPDGIPEPYTLRLCALHVPSLEGSADATARGQDGAYWSSGSLDAGGETNTRWCKLLHGDGIPSGGMVS